MLRIIFSAFVLFLPVLLPVSADATGTRLDKNRVTDMAAYSYERGQKAEAKAEQYLTDRSSASGQKAESLGNKAMKQYGKAAKMYERALRANPKHRGARLALGPSLLKSATPAEAARLLADAVKRYPDNPSLEDHLNKARTALSDTPTQATD